MQYVDIAITASITMLTFGLLLLTLNNYRKKKNQKLLFLGGVFLVFFIKELLVSLRLFSRTVPLVDEPMNLWLFDIIILLLLFIGTIKR